jgi:hypothetical protein
MLDTLLQKDPAARGAGARWLANQLRGWLNRHEVVDIVDHTRAFIAGLDLQPRNTLIRAAASVSRSSRTGSALRAPSAVPGRETVAAQSGTAYAPAHPTTGALGPSSRSPLVWVGAFLAVAVLVLAGAVLWNTLGEKTPEPPALASRPAAAKPVFRPGNPAAVPEAPLAAEPALSVPKTAAPAAERTAEQRMLPSNAAPSPKPKAPSRPAPQRPPRPRPAAAETPAPAGEQAEASRMGFVLIKSAPPFAALTINGRPQGETPMSSWLEVPAGKCHIEIVHRLTPPFDTVISVSPGTRQEFKFKLDR